MADELPFCRRVEEDTYDGKEQGEGPLCTLRPLVARIMFCLCRLEEQSYTRLPLVLCFFIVCLMFRLASSTL